MYFTCNCAPKPSVLLPAVMYVQQWPCPAAANATVMSKMPSNLVLMACGHMIARPYTPQLACVGFNPTKLRSDTAISKAISPDAQRSSMGLNSCRTSITVLLTVVSAQCRSQYIIDVNTDIGQTVSEALVTKWPLLLHRERAKMGRWGQATENM